MIDRLSTSRGPIRLWAPADPSGVIILLHGYHDTVESLWTRYAMEAQLAGGARAAVHILPATPSGPREGVYWPDLLELLETVDRALGRTLPTGPICVLAHSGAYRTLLPWLPHPWLAHVVALDCTYCEAPAYRAAIDRGMRLDLVTCTPAPRRVAREILRHLPHVKLPEVPLSWTAEQRAAQVVAIDSRASHMGLVAGGHVIPAMLRRLPISEVPCPHA